MHHALLIRVNHWAIVFCLIITYLSAYYRYWYTLQAEPLNWYLLVIHMNAGGLVFIFTLVSIYYNLMKTTVFVDKLASVQQTLSQLMHYCLYLMMVIIPVSAYIGTGFDFSLLGLVNLPGFFRIESLQHWLVENYQMQMITFIQPFGIFHRDISVELILPILLFGHIGATLYHVLIIRDKVFQKIWFS